MAVPPGVATCMSLEFVFLLGIIGAFVFSAIAVVGESTKKEIQRKTGFSSLKSMFLATWIVVFLPAFVVGINQVSAAFPILGPLSIIAAIGFTFWAALWSFPIVLAGYFICTSIERALSCVITRARTAHHLAVFITTFSLSFILLAFAYLSIFYLWLLIVGLIATPATTLAAVIVIVITYNRMRERTEKHN